jgi:hypothetical protein
MAYFGHPTYDFPAELAKALRGDRHQPARSRRRTTKELRTQVLDLREKGMVPGGIANTLDISERRVRAILRDS